MRARARGKERQRGLRAPLNPAGYLGNGEDVNRGADKGCRWPRRWDLRESQSLPRGGRYFVDHDRVLMGLKKAKGFAQPLSAVLLTKDLGAINFLKGARRLV